MPSAQPMLDLKPPRTHFYQDVVDGLQRDQKSLPSKYFYDQQGSLLFDQICDLDEYYLFYSGGHSGQIFVSGIPSMRHIATIPVFTPYPGTGYGFDDESKEMLGGYTWGDSHHPGFSETNGEYDGRWLFINDNAQGRIARIDLKDFKVKQILRVPNISANHGSSFVTPNTEYVSMATRIFQINPFSPMSSLARPTMAIRSSISAGTSDGPEPRRSARFNISSQPTRGASSLYTATGALRWRVQATNSSLAPAPTCRTGT